jgi:hypothetical protein
VHQKYIDVGFMTFSMLEKVGLNPASDFNTPLGIYTYPITHQMIDDLKNHNIPFASTRKFIHVLTLKNDSTIIDVGSMTINEALSLANNINDLIYSPHISESQFLFFTNASRQKTPGGRLWFFTMTMRENSKIKGSSSSTFAWNKLFRMIGVAGATDFGEGIIYPGEPTQAVFFSINAINHVDTLLNPEIAHYKKLQKRDINYDKRFFRALLAAKQSGAKELSDYIAWFNDNDIKIDGKSVSDYARKTAFDGNEMNKYANEDEYSRASSAWAYEDLDKTGEVAGYDE